MPGMSADARELLKRFRKTTSVLRAKVDAAVRDLARETRDRVRHDYWRNRTGQTRSKTVVERLGRAHYRVAVKVPWAGALDRGSRPHVIKARRAKALGPFRGRGRKGRFARSVKHPGTRGYDFSRKEALRARGLLPARVAEAFRAAGK